MVLSEGFNLDHPLACIDIPITLTVVAQQLTAAEIGARRMEMGDKWEPACALDMVMWSPQILLQVPTVQMDGTIKLVPYAVADSTLRSGKHSMNYALWTNVDNIVQQAANQLKAEVVRRALANAMPSEVIGKEKEECQPQPNKESDLF